MNTHVLRREYRMTSIFLLRNQGEDISHFLFSPSYWEWL